MLVTNVSKLHEIKLHKVKSIKELQQESEQTKEAIGFLMGFEVLKNFFNDDKEKYKHFITRLKKIPSRRHGVDMDLAEKFFNLVEFYYRVSDRYNVFAAHGYHGVELVASIALVESLMIENYKTFEEWLPSTLQEERNWNLTEGRLDKLIKRYRDENGTTRAFRKFLETYAKEDLKYVKQAFEFNENEFTLNQVINLLIEYRNDFIHNAISLPFRTQKSVDEQYGRFPRSATNPNAMLDFRDNKLYSIDLSEITIEKYLAIFERALMRFFESRVEKYKTD